MCFGNEAFYGLLYISHFWPGPSLYFVNFMNLMAFLVFPVAAVKSTISLVRFYFFNFLRIFKLADFFILKI